MSLNKSKTPQPVIIKGKELQCPVCGNKSFSKRRAQLNSAVATFFNLDWTNRSASCYVCSECTHILWFLDE
ncbi:MAG: hypothetical protein JXJ22_12150 [Bacteroidales bacterium]|nr:hypothetical protein [Bacteroidales bacterium]